MNFTLQFTCVKRLCPKRPHYFSVPWIVCDCKRFTGPHVSDHMVAQDPGPKTTIIWWGRPQKPSSWFIIRTIETLFWTSKCYSIACDPGFNTYTARPVCWSGWISDSYCSLKPLCSGMGEVVPAHTSPTLLPPSPRTVLSLSCFKVSQCINCRDWHCKS